MRGHCLRSPIIFRPMPLRTRPRLRATAALLASMGLLALPLRSLAACPMVEAVGIEAPAEHASHGAVAAHDEHAGHDMPDASGDGPATPGSPTHDVCPDLAHCAVATMATPLTLPIAPTVPVVALRMTALTAPLSVARALEPPPPKP